MQKLLKIATRLSSKIGVRGDYILHFMVGLAFGLLYLILSLLHTVLIASVVFIGKEVWDKYKPNPTGFDWLDLIADYLGLTISILTIWLIF